MSIKINILDKSGEYFIHRSYNNQGIPINLKHKFNKFELLVLFSFDNYDQTESQIITNKNHYKIEDSFDPLLHHKIFPLIKDLLIKTINSTFLIKDQKYKRKVRTILYNEIKHLNLLLGIKLEYKIYDKIHYFSQYPLYHILFDFIEGNNIETSFNYEVMKLILNTTKQIKYGYKQFDCFEYNFGKFAVEYEFYKPVFEYYCNLKQCQEKITLIDY